MIGSLSFGLTLFTYCNGQQTKVCSRILKKMENYNEKQKIRI